MVNTGTQLTLEEFLALPEADVNYEFVDGQAVPKVSPKDRFLKRQTCCSDRMLVESVHDR